MQYLSLRLCIALIIVAIGVTGLAVGIAYEFGTTLRMGPGYMPVVLSSLLVILGLIEGGSAVLNPAGEEEVAALQWRPFFAILMAVVGFALSIAYLGMLPAFLVCIGFASLAERGYGVVPAVILAVITCLFAWLLFSQLLGMTLPLVRLGG